MNEVYVEDMDICSLGKLLMSGKCKVKHRDTAIYFTCKDGIMRGHDIDMHNHDPFEDGAFEAAILAYYGEQQTFCDFMVELAEGGFNVTLQNAKGDESLSQAQCAMWINRVTNIKEIA